MTICVNSADHWRMIKCPESGCDYLEPTYAAMLAKQGGVDKVLGEVRVTDPLTGGEKGRKPEEYALLPVKFWAEVARVYGVGAQKYAPRNWEKGYAWSLSYSAAQRHLNAFWGGEEMDPETGLHHLGCAAFHLGSLYTFEREGLGTDDRAT